MSFLLSYVRPVGHNDLPMPRGAYPELRALSIEPWKIARLKRFWKGEYLLELRRISGAIRRRLESWPRSPSQLIMREA